MADTIDPTNIVALTEALKKASEQHDTLRRMMEALKQSAPDVFAKVSAAAASLKPAMDGAASAVAAVGDTVEKVAKRAAMSFEELTDDVNKEFKELATGLGINFGDVAIRVASATTGYFLGVPKSVNAATYAIEGFKQEAESALKVIDRFRNIPVFGAIADFGKGAYEQYDAGRNYETALMQRRATSGSLGEDWDKQFDGMALNAAMDKYTQTLYGVARASGMSMTSTQKFAQDLMKIPGALEAAVPSGGSATQSINLLEASMRLARGTTQNFADTFTFMESQFNRFGEIGQKPLEAFSKLFSASSSLQIPFDKMNANIGQITQSFEFLGNNTESAIRMFEDMVPALRASGLGPESAMKLATGVADAVSKLGIAQKGFLSAQSGGPGGLMGGYQIERMLRDGRLDEVNKMMRDSLMQNFGGSIVGLDEAATDQNAAAQYTKQLAFLTDGPFGALVRDVKEAQRLLEAFSKGTDAGVKETGEDAYSRAMMAGGALQERQTDLMQVANLEVEKFQFDSMAVNYETGRKAIGTESEGGIGRFLYDYRRENVVSGLNTGNVQGLQPIDRGREVVDGLRAKINSIFGDLFTENYGRNNTGINQDAEDSRRENFSLARPLRSNNIDGEELSRRSGTNSTLTINVQSNGLDVKQVEIIADGIIEAREKQKVSGTVVPGIGSN